MEFCVMKYESLHIYFSQLVEDKVYILRYVP